MKILAISCKKLNTNDNIDNQIYVVKFLQILNDAKVVAVHYIGAAQSVCPRHVLHIYSLLGVFHCPGIEHLIYKVLPRLRSLCDKTRLGCSRALTFASLREHILAQPFSASWRVYKSQKSGAWGHIITSLLIFAHKVWHIEKGEKGVHKT